MSSASEFVVTPRGDFYPPNRTPMPVMYWPNYLMPYSQYRFTPYRAELPGAFVAGARQAVLAYNTPGMSCVQTVSRSQF